MAYANTEDLYPMLQKEELMPEPGSDEEIVIMTMSTSEIWEAAVDAEGNPLYPDKIQFEMFTFVIHMLTSNILAPSIRGD